MRAAISRLHKISYLLPIALFALASPASRAGEHIYAATDPTWKAECGACHIAYPPALLPAESWRTLMAQLDRHFGTDASVDAATAQSIAAFLERNADKRRSTNAAPALRITETRWFQHEHDEVPTRIWKSAAVKSAANCEACHAQAAHGDFSDRTRRVPR